MKKSGWILLLGCLCLATTSCGTKRVTELMTEESVPSNVSLQKKVTLDKGESKTIAFDMEGGFFSPDHNSVSIIVEKLEGESYQYILENVTDKEIIAKDIKTETFAGTIKGLNEEKKYELTVTNLGIKDLTVTITMTSFVSMDEKVEEESLQETTEPDMEGTESTPMATLYRKYKPLSLVIHGVEYELQLGMKHGTILFSEHSSTGTYELQLVTPDTNTVIASYDKEFLWETQKGDEWVWVADYNEDGRQDFIVSQYLCENLKQYFVYSVTDDLNIVEIDTKIGEALNGFE